jgi:hypothetical protein
MKNNIDKPLLITTAINPPMGMPYLKMTNPTLRKITSKASVYYWIGLGFRNLIIADATNSCLFDSDEINELTLLDVNVEQLFYAQDELSAVSKGKGYAEGLLLNFALVNSNIIKQHESFFKSTGKIFVRNINEINKIIQINNIKTIFWRYLGDGSSQQPFADTRFYFCDKSFALNNLVPAYLKADDKISACEYHVFNMLNSNMKPGSKALRPKITGFEGGTGSMYFDDSLGYLDYEFPCWVSIK